MGQDTPIDPRHRAEIIDRLYDVAVDPARYEQLIDIWESRIAPLRPNGRSQDFRDRELETHVARAGLFLDRFEETARASGLEAALAELGRAAAFASADGVTVFAANEAARKAFAIMPGCPLSDLPLEAGDIAGLQAAMTTILRGDEEPPAMLRARAQRSRGPVMMRLKPHMEAGDRRFAVVVTTQLAWPDQLTDTIREAFDLTLAEVEIVRAVTEGKPVKDIARERGRSAETVRTQLRSILAKTETHSQSELVRITVGLMDVVGSTVPPVLAASVGGGLRAVPFSTMSQPAGRRYDYIEFGAPDGRPCLYLPMDYGLIRWPASAEASAERRGIRVVVPVRAGFGHSGQMPACANYGEETARDMLRLLDHLGIERAALLSTGADLRFAMQLIGLAPAHFSGLLACAGMLPVTRPEQYERMDKWQRFINANARYAPQILPFLVKAGYSMARRLGKDRFFAAVNAGSPSDLKAFADPEIREAMILGSEISLSAQHSSHAAFAREVIDMQRDWTALVRDCAIPALLLQGGQDPQAPVETVREQMVDFPNLRFEIVDEAGQLLFFQEWPRALNELERFLPPA